MLHKRTSFCLFAAPFILVLADAYAKLQPTKAPPPLAQEARTWNFDTDKVGEAPDGWLIRSTHPGPAHATWQVTADPTAPSKPNVFTITKTQNKGSTFNLAIRSDARMKDVEVGVRIRPNSGKEDQGGGLIWRCKDESNYYICRANPLESNFRVYKVVDGKRIQLQSTKVKMQTGKWYTIKAIMVGNQITCSLDGGNILEATDDAIQDAGMIGLWSKADAASSFDDFTLQGPHDTRYIGPPIRKPPVGEKKPKKPGDDGDEK
jgi:hypothetical protein